MGQRDVQGPTADFMKKPGKKNIIPRKVRQSHAGKMPPSKKIWANLLLNYNIDFVAARMAS